MTYFIAQNTDNCVACDCYAALWYIDEMTDLHYCNIEYGKNDVSHYT